MEKLDKKISVVIPCYNEEKNIPELYGRLSGVLQDMLQRYEIIFVDNCSRDRTRDMLRDLAVKDNRVKVLFFARNSGNSQSGYSAGTEYASGDAVVWMEADLQDPPEVIGDFVKKWQEGFSVVYGVRSRMEGSRLSRWFRKTFYRLFDRLSYLDIPRDAGDFSLLDRRAADVFNAMPERSRFVRGMRAWLGFRHAGVAYERPDRKAGVTSNPGFWRNFWWARKFIFSFSYAPFDFITRVACWFLLLTPVLILGVGILAWADAISGLAALAAAGVILMAAFQCLAFAFLGETLSIVFEEVKQRPKYIVEETINI